MENKILSTLELNELIVQKAAEDEGFRLALLSDPKSALEKELGVVIPEDIKIEVHVESMKALHLIIPAAHTDELTDDDLDAIAGGVAAKPGGPAMMYAVRPHFDPTKGNQSGSTGWIVPLRPRL